jgi:hypothetical protein
MGPRAAALVAGIIDRIEDRPPRTGRPPMPTTEAVEALHFSSSAKACHGGNCGLRPGAPAVPPRAVAWMTGAPHGRAAPGPCRPGPDGARGARGRALGRGGRRLLGAGRARRRADRPRPRRPRQGGDQGPRGGLDRRPPAGRCSLGRRRPRHAALPASAAPGPGGLRRHRRAVCGRRAAYDGAENRGLRPRDGIQPPIRRVVGEPHGSGLGAVRCVVERDCARLLANKRLDRRRDGPGRVILALLIAACILIVANRFQAF